MKKYIYFATLLIFFISLQTGTDTGSANSTSSSTQNSIAGNEIVFSIPIGDNGIHYKISNGPDTQRWGPPAFTVAPDGSFWIADTPDDHLLRFSSKGVLLNKINTRDFIIGAGDIEVTSTDIWVLDIASIPPKLVNLSLDGEIIDTHNLPKGLHLEDGLSGIAIEGDSSILIEQGGGHTLTRFISSSGEIKHDALQGYESQGIVYAAFPADQSSKDASDGYILVGTKRIDVKVANTLGGLNILHVNSDHSFFAQIMELVLNTAFQIDLKVYHYDSFGNLVGMARVPLEAQYTYVPHGIAVGPDDKIYALITKPDGGEIQRLTFSNELLPILTPYETSIELGAPQGLSSQSESCRTRESMIGVALGYLYNSTYLDSYHINDNSTCLSRLKPRYLGSAGTYSSVPYAWGMWDTVDQFNSFMSGGNNGYFAGDIDDPNSGCGRGIDCSGLVSRAWGLGSHYGTCLLESVSSPVLSVYSLQRGDILNRCSITPRHTIIFDRFMGDGILGYEATIEFNHDKVVRIYRSFDSITNFVPLKYYDICKNMHLPLINKSDMEMSSANSSVDPYPAPDPSLSSSPYPSPQYDR